MKEETVTTETAATVAAQGAHVAPEKTHSKKSASPKKGAPKGKKGAKPKAAPLKSAAKAAKKAATKKASTPGAESKGAKILGLIARSKGATLAEIMKATGWQAHSVRGFLSTAAKKDGINIESERNEAGDRVYRTAK